MSDTETVTNVFNPQTGDLTVTIKYGKGYDDPWAVFKGQTKDDVRQQILDYYEPDPESVEGLSLHELVVNMNRLTHSVSTASNVLGGTVTNQPGKSSGWGGKPQASEPAAPAAPAEPEVDPLLAKFEAAATVAELKELFARNPRIKTTPDLLNAWKAAGKTLQTKENAA